MPAVLHFGECINEGKYGFRLSRDEYAIPNRRSSFYVSRESLSDRIWKLRGADFVDDEQKMYTDEWLVKQRELALVNFDLNMEFCALLEQDEFELELAKMQELAPKLYAVHEIPKWDEVEGLYVMVLDDYKQLYVGQSANIRKRIKEHWTGTQQFDRLLWGPAKTSILSIDSFRALDTTRIFAVKTKYRDRLERKLVNEIESRFLLNRVGGGRVMSTLEGLEELTTPRTRELE